jgi:aminoglycoside phosphotransferase (APT) family kinase protein
MNPSEIERAKVAVTSIAAEVGLEAESAIVVHNSNNLALRVLPCDVFARVAYEGRERALFEIDLAQRLAETGSPVAALEPRVEPRVYQRDGFAVTFWTYYEPLPREIPPVASAEALARLHADMRDIDLPWQHFTARVGHAQRLVAERDETPELPGDERELLADALASMRRAIEERGAREQLLHGEPHPGNLLNTKEGPRFIDLETCCRGPIEFDLAYLPEEVCAHYPGVDQELLRECRILMLAMVITWRWERDDQLPNGRELEREWLRQMRAELATRGLDVRG